MSRHLHERVPDKPRFMCRHCRDVWAVGPLPDADYPARLRAALDAAEAKLERVRAVMEGVYSMPDPGGDRPRWLVAGMYHIAHKIRAVLEVE